MYVFSHDEGVGPATALAVKYSSLVKRLRVSEYALPGFGYEAAVVPGYFWDLCQTFQLAFFSIPGAAEFFILDREKQMLEWYFYHMSHSGVTAFPEDIVNRYATSISKPGFLKATFGPFAAKSIGEDASHVNATLGVTPLAIPVLAIGGVAGFGQAVGGAFETIMTNLVTDIVPKDGHRIADENPVWVANRIIKFLSEDTASPEAVDLSSLEDKVTLTVGYLGTYRNQEIAKKQPWAGKWRTGSWDRIFCLGTLQ